MTHLVSSTPPISGAHTVKRYAGFGILGANIPATGDSGGSPVLNDSVDPTGEYYWRVETPPSGSSGGTLTIYPDLSFSFTGASDGSWPWVYRLFKTGTDLGTATVNQTVGTGSGVSVSLSGQSFSLLQGSIAKAYSAGLSGIANPVTAGLIVSGTSKALTGQAYSFAQGSPSASTIKNVGLTGIAVTFSTGAFGVNTGSGISLPLSGQSYSYSQGSVSAGASIPVPGAAISFATGSVAANSASSVSVQLNGVSFSFSPGALTASTIGAGSSLGQADIDAIVAAVTPAVAAAVWAYISRSLTPNGNNDVADTLLTREWP